MNIAPYISLSPDLKELCSKTQSLQFVNHSVINTPPEWASPAVFVATFRKFLIKKTFQWESGKIQQLFLPSQSASIPFKIFL